MSNKTLKQRIALVAASALTAGFLSVVATPSANAFNTEDGYISSTSGSTGLIAAGTIASNTADTTKTGVILSTGSLVLTITSTAAVVTVGAGASITAASGTITADQTCTTATTGQSVTIKPTGAVGSTFTVSVYSDNACADAATLTERAVVTIAGTDASGVAVAANSYINWASTNSAVVTTESAADAADVTGGLLFIYVQLRDAYKANITSTSGALIATASSGAVTQIAATGAAVAGTAATAVSAASPAALWVSVGEATSGAGWAGTVTISYNGVVLATKTGKITGKASKLTVAALKVGSNTTGTANAAALSYQVTDTAGNNVVVAYTDIVYSSSTNAALVAAAAGDVVNTTASVGTATFTCVQSVLGVGTADIVLQTTLTDGTIIKSNAVTVRCGGTAAKYTASWDKATYSQGDVAILTVSFTDVVGSPANSYTAVSATDQVITALQMERVTAHAAAATVGASSTIAYTFTVGTASGAVSGAYQAVLSYPTVNTAGATIKTGNTTAGYSISAGAAVVSNADVLKSIVALIASINKQIQALQKLILKR